jgi:hypothetical protein
MNNFKLLFGFSLFSFFISSTIAQPLMIQPSVEAAIEWFSRDAKVNAQIESNLKGGYELAGEPYAVPVSRTCRTSRKHECIGDYFVFQPMKKVDSLYHASIRVAANVFIPGFLVTKPAGVRLLVF